MVILRWTLGWVLAVAGTLWTLIGVATLASLLAQGEAVDVWATVQLFSVGLLWLLGGLLAMSDAR